MRQRSLERRHTGIEHGFIRRIVSPEDLGHRLKPFVFLDFIHGAVPNGGGFGFHPHSGIATVTYQHSVDIVYEDTTGQNGIVEARGIEWVQAGGGLWHRAVLRPKKLPATGFQLWLALPPDLEQVAASAAYLPPDQVPSVENVRILLGDYQGVRSPIVAPYPINYFDVTLSAGQTFAFLPPPDHQVAWAFVYEGRVSCCDIQTTEELLIFDREPGVLSFSAQTDSGLMLATSPVHDHTLAIGWSSVHTSPEVLSRCEARIAEMGKSLRQQGRIP